MIRPIFIFCLLFSTLALARADLVIEQESVDTNATSRATLSLQGDQMRMDETNSKGANFSVIINLQTRDSTTLMPKIKQFLKRPGIQAKAQVKSVPATYAATNEMFQPPARSVDMGDGGKVGGYQTELYTWKGAYGLLKNMWVATNFPGYDYIQQDLAKIDHFNDSGMHRNAQPQLSLLPGMVLKTETWAYGTTNTTMLVFVKQEPVSTNLFEPPPGYTPYIPWKKHGPQPTNVMVIPSK